MRRITIIMLAAMLMAVLLVQASFAEGAGMAGDMEQSLSPPTGLRVLHRDEDAGKRISLTWRCEEEAFGYRVYRSDNAEGPFLDVGSKAGDSMLEYPVFLDDTEEAGVEYYYRVATVDEEGLESAQSQTVCALLEGSLQAAAGAKGERRVPAAVTNMDGHGGSIRVDNRGNIYVLQIGLPKGFTPPKGFEQDPAYLRCTGTIHRFGPEGGQFKAPRRGPIAPVGAKASYPGCAPLSGRWSSTISVCVCTKPRFDVDGFGRLYIPNAFTYKVRVVDNAGNPILRFGGYGNFDAAGPGSAEPKPEIPLGWPITAGASDRYIYVGDCLNHRVVRADKVFAAEATCKVK